MFRLLEIVLNLVITGLFIAFFLGVVNNNDKDTSPLSTVGGFFKTSYVIGL